jgi:hypothetical protein
MAGFKEMAAEEIWELIKGHQDVLTPAAQAEQEFFRQVSCPSCGGKSHDQMLHAARPFSEGAILPNKILVCQQCKTEFEPRSGIILRSAPSQIDPLSNG